MPKFLQTGLRHIAQLTQWPNSGKYTGLSGFTDAFTSSSKGTAGLTNNQELAHLNTLTSLFKFSPQNRKWLDAPAGWIEGLAVAGYTCTPIGATVGTASVEINRVLPDDDDQVGPPGEGGGGLGAVQSTITYYVHTCQ